MFHRILLPLDGSAGSETAAPFALGLAKALDAEVIVCQIITTPVTPNSGGEEREAGEYTARVAERFRDEGIVVKTLVRRGQAPNEIEKAALEWGVDAICMATHARRPLDKLVLGSVADVLVRNTQLPVLLVSSQKRKAKKRLPRVA
jgi:nucleotide-binding universal stress UspA family protein